MHIVYLPCLTLPCPSFLVFHLPDTGTCLSRLPRQSPMLAVGGYMAATLVRYEDTKMQVQMQVQVQVQLQLQLQ